MTKVSPGAVRRRIEHFFDDADLDVVVRKRRHMYCVYGEHDMQPLARLRMTGRFDRTELDYWDGDHWEPASEFGTAVPLDEALELIKEDPDDVFFEDAAGDHDHDEAPLSLDAEQVARLQAVANLLFGKSAFGAAVGAMFGDLRWAIAGSAIAILLTELVWSLREVGVRRRAMFWTVGRSLCLVPFAWVGGVTGSAVFAGMGGGGWARVVAGLAAASCCWFLLQGGRFAWCVGLLAGVTVSLAAARWWQLDGLYVGFLLVACSAAATAELCRATISKLHRFCSLSVEAFGQPERAVSASTKTTSAVTFIAHK